MTDMAISHKSSQDRLLVIHYHPCLYGDVMSMMVARYFTHLVAEMGYVDVSVLEVGDEHQVIVYHHVREKVEESDIAETKELNTVDHTSQGGNETNIGPDDIQTLPRAKQGREGVEVVIDLALVLLGASGIEEEVTRHPSHRKHEDNL